MRIEILFSDEDTDSSGRSFQTVGALVSLTLVFSLDFGRDRRPLHRGSQSAKGFIRD